MFQLLKESFRDNLWACLGKFDRMVPEDYDFPVVATVYQDVPSLAYPIDTTDYYRRVRVVAQDIVERGRLGGDTTYMIVQGRRLLGKCVALGYEDLAWHLEVELACIEWAEYQ